MRGVVNDCVVINSSYNQSIKSLRTERSRASERSDQEPRNGAIKSLGTERSRASERSDQAIKDDFHRSKFLIPVANASTGDVFVTTPCSSCMMACMPSVTIPLHGGMIVPCTAAISLKINFARLQGEFVRTPSNPPWLRAWN